MPLPERFAHELWSGLAGDGSEAASRCKGGAVRGGGAEVGPQAASHLALEVLQTTTTVAILWLCLRRRTLRSSGFLPLSLRPTASAPPASWFYLLLGTQRTSVPA